MPEGRLQAGDFAVVVTDVDLVRKIMSLPAEQREEILKLLGDNEKPDAAARPDELHRRFGRDVLRRHDGRAD